MKILLVEDDHIIGPNIKEYLEESGFIVDLITNGKEAFIKALENENHYDLIILDVMLPEKDGFSIAKALRSLKNQIPIIFLTAKDDFESKQEGFLVGGDDYLTKPFKLKELLLRIKAILKRVNKQQDSSNKLVYKNLVLDLDTRKVLKDNKEIELTPTEFKILEFLMKNAQKVVPKHEILEYVWGINNDIWSDVVRTHIKSLRDKIGKDFIQTVRGVGFKLGD